MKILNLKTIRWVVLAYMLLELLGGKSIGFLPFSASAAAQTALTQTTLSAAVNGGGPYSGVSQQLDMQITVASVTGFVAALSNNNVQSYAYIDREAVAVIGVNSTTKIVTVMRGQLGTIATPHASGQMVLVAQTNTPGANAFFQYDPSGKCTTAATLSTPWVNVLTADQWLCSTITTNWVPGFGNTGASGIPQQVTAAVASAAGLITPSGPLFHITGALAITGFNIPVGFNATALGGGSFCVIPDGTFTTTTANNIALASTAVVNKLLCWSWDATNSKFVPTY